MNFPPHIQERISRGMGCGSGIGDGWVPLVIELDAKLADIDPDYVIDQIKEKFGTLRYYISRSSTDDSQYHAIYDLISEYEAKSGKTCELCGEPGETRWGGWVRTLCDQHAEEKGKL